MESEMQLAGRWRRFWACFIDIWILNINLLPFTMMIKGIKKPLAQFTVEQQAYIFLLSCTFFVITNGYLLHRRGQTLGKCFLKIKIVNSEGATPALWKLLLRHVPLLLTKIPVGYIVALLDGLLIFRKDRRCIHDRLAGTTVIAKQLPGDSAHCGHPPAALHRSFRRNDFFLFILPIFATDCMLVAFYHYFFMDSVFYMIWYFLLAALVCVQFFWGKDTPYMRITEQEFTLYPAMIRKPQKAAWADISGLQRPKKNTIHVILKDKKRIKVSLFAINKDERNDLLHIFEDRVQGKA